MKINAVTPIKDAIREIYELPPKIKKDAKINITEPIHSKISVPVKYFFFFLHNSLANNLQKLRKASAYTSSKT